MKKLTSRQITKNTDWYLEDSEDDIKTFYQHSSDDNIGYIMTFWEKTGKANITKFSGASGVLVLFNGFIQSIDDLYTLKRMLLIE